MTGAGRRSQRRRVEPGGCRWLWRGASWAPEGGEGAARAVCPLTRAFVKTDVYLFKAVPRCY